jgi:outer membrane protein OmpA-like peptidoglycan-associated protein
LVLGTNNFLAFTGDKIYGANVYAAIKIPIPYGKPRDRDHDGVSNRKDHCKKIPGTWETHGCPDTDGDGIADDKDKCPTVKGPKENDGCPYPDRDSDGVADKDDKCPDVKGTVANFGCPEDKDNDGVTDDVDKCPTVAGPKENFGCPYTDRDSDGVLDKDDKCPDVKGPVENLGCPYGDSDGDGVPDNIDKCIHDKGPAENGGCPWPDTDGDGVLDKDDQCPKTPGPVENHGCPVLKEKEKEILKKAFDNLEFVSGQAIIRSTSFASLNTLAELLKEKPDATLLIAGHTDNTGSHEINMKLSKARAEAVKKELMARGVKADQLNVEYYGETKPIADNNTAAGRQKNRRVEMTMSYK